MTARIVTNDAEEMLLLGEERRLCKILAVDTEGVIVDILGRDGSRTRELHTVMLTDDFVPPAIRFYAPAFAHHGKVLFVEVIDCVQLGDSLFRVNIKGRIGDA